ncbi:MAG: hypothetical protein RL596_636, partial [Bacteroidota bacterium]
MLSIIIINYRSAAHIENLLLSAEKHPIQSDVEWIIVDNASGDDSEERLCNMFPFLRWENMGYKMGGDEVIFPGGYNQITDELANDLDIRLTTIVNTVRYSSDGVEVETSLGRFVADKAVVTFPLGVLKQASVKFEPPLPASKQEAIDRLEMGILNKVYLKFSEAFWGEDVETISYLGEKLGGWCDWLSFVPFTGEPVLMAFHGGDKGFALEDLSDEEIRDGAMKTLRVMFGDDIPNPDGMLVTRWGKD